MHTQEKILIPKLFGTDGIRGHANASPMTVELALALGRAVGKIFRSHPGKHALLSAKIRGFLATCMKMPLLPDSVLWESIP